MNAFSFLYGTTSGDHTLPYYLRLACVYWSCSDASATAPLQLAAVFAPYGTADRTAVPHTLFHHNIFQSGINLQPEELFRVDNRSLKANMTSS